MALASAVACAPVVTATVRALARGWIPVGDNAYFTIRARDVLTEHHPLVGAWSSGSDAIGVDVNNLGPLQLDLLAPFVWLGGFGPGTAIAVALINAASAVAVVVLVHRRLGGYGAWIGAAMAAGTTWALGSELLYEPRQHHALVLPFLALLVAAWAVVAGERWALPVATILTSLIAQTHFTFVVPGVALAIVAGAWSLWGLARGSGWRAPVLVSLGIAAVAWAQPLVEQLTADGQGNLSAVIEASGREVETFGTGAALRAVAEVVGPPSGWWPSSFREFDPASLDVSRATAAATLLVVAGLLVGLGLRARRAGDGPVVTWLGVAGVALASAVVASARVPVSGPFGAVSGNFRFLWPVAVFTTFGIVTAVLRGLPEGARRPAGIGTIAVAVLLALAAVPSSYQSPGPEADAPLIPLARSLKRQVEAADITGPVLVERSGLFFGEPYTYVVVAALQEEGVDLVFDTPTDVARFGEDRRHEGPVAGSISLVTGEEALDDRPGSTLVARASDPDADHPSRSSVAVWFTPSR